MGNDYYFTILLGEIGFVISCPKLIEEIAFDPNISEKPKIIYGMLEKYVHGLFTNPGFDSEYKSRKKEFNSSMKPYLITGPYHESFIKYAIEVINLIKRDQNMVDIRTLMYFYTLNSSHESLFGGKQCIPIERKAFAEIMLAAKAISHGLLLPIFAYLFAAFLSCADKQIFKDIITKADKLTDDALKKIEKYDLGDLPKDNQLPLLQLIALRNKMRDSPKVAVKKEFVELIMAATHTVASSLTGGLMMLATLPEIQEKIWEEQYEIFGNSDRDPTVEDVRKMEYLDRVTNEVLRFHGPSFIVKRTTGDVTLNGVTIPKGTNILMLLRPSRMDPRYWKNPKSFDPDHFLKEIDRPKLSSSAFGVGVRACPGKIYGLHEMKVLISMLSRKFKFSSRLKFEDIEFHASILDEVKNFDMLQAEERMKKEDKI